MNAIVRLEHDFTAIVDAIAGPGIGIFPGFINADMVAALRHDLATLPPGS